MKEKFVMMCVVLVIVISIVSYLYLEVHGPLMLHYHF